MTNPANHLESPPSADDHTEDGRLFPPRKIPDFYTVAGAEAAAKYGELINKNNEIDAQAQSRILRRLGRIAG